MKKHIYLVLAYLLFPLLAFSQVSKNYLFKGKVLDSIGKEYLFKPAKREAIETQLMQEFHKSKDKELIAFMELMRFSATIDSNALEVEQFSSQIESKYKAHPNIQAMAYRLISYHYFLKNVNYERAFNAYLQLEKLLAVYGPDVISDYSFYCGEIAAAYYKFKNYKKSVEMGKKGAKYASDKWEFYNTMGLCYRELSQPDSAIHYLNKAVNEAIILKKRDIYRTISLGNIGIVYYRQRKYKAAKPLLKIDLAGALRADDKGLAVGSAIPLADIYITEKNLSMADSLLKMSRSYIAESKQYERLEHLFPVQSKYFQNAGNFSLALAYRDSTIYAVKRNDSVFNSLLLLKVQQRTDLQNLIEEKNKLENYRKLSALRLWAIGIILVLGIITLLIVRRYKKRLAKDKKHIEDLNRTLALRQRLSADMHDDIGSTLSSISLYTHSLLIQSTNNDQKITLQKIKQNAQSIQESIGDIIWSVNPYMDVMQQVVARMRAFGADMTEHAGISFHFKFDEEVVKLQIDMSTRRNLYLIYKEAINNAVKYSACREIQITLQHNNQQFTMEINDDGKGFDVHKNSSGNGLTNMNNRAIEINGKLKIRSNSQGTLLTLAFPLHLHS